MDPRTNHSECVWQIVDKKNEYQRNETEKKERLNEHTGEIDTTEKAKQQKGAHKKTTTLITFEQRNNSYVDEEIHRNAKE